jgi:putative NADH-flavin reductase
MAARLIVFGATGSLGRHVLRQAPAAGHEVTALVRTPARLPAEARAKVSVHVVDLRAIAPAELARLIAGHDALVNCAGHVNEGQAFVELVDRVVSAAELLPGEARPACWFLAGAALLDIGAPGRRGVDLPVIRNTYWPHLANFERLGRSSLDWRLLCPGPMVEEPAIGLERLRISVDALPVAVPGFARVLPGAMLVPAFASLVPQMIVPYADAAAVMLAHLERGDAMARHRVGLALPPGMRGRKPRWTARARDAV